MLVLKNINNINYNKFYKFMIDSLHKKIFHIQIQTFNLFLRLILQIKTFLYPRAKHSHAYFKSPIIKNNYININNIPKLNSWTKKPNLKEHHNLIIRINKINIKGLENKVTEILTNHPELKTIINSLLTISRFSNNKTEISNHLNELILISKNKEKLKKFENIINQKLEEIFTIHNTEKLKHLHNSRKHDILIPPIECLTTDYAQILAHFIIDDHGHIDETALSLALKHGTPNSISSTHGQYVKKIYKKLQSNLGKQLSQLTAPKNQTSQTTLFIRMALNKNINDPITHTDTRRAALICLLDNLYQEPASGTCYTSSIAMNVRTHFPEIFLNDLQHIIHNNHYTRTVQNMPYAFFPMIKASDIHLDEDLIKKITTTHGNTEFTYFINNISNRKRLLNENSFFSIINAFKTANINITSEEIIELLEKTEGIETNYYYDDNNKNKISIEISQLNEYLKKSQENEGTLIKLQSLPIKKLIQSLLLKYFKTTLNTLKENPIQYNQYTHLKNWIHQSFSNNQTTRLLRSWEYSLGTGTLDATQKTNVNNHRGISNTFAAWKIISLFNLTTQFDKLQKILYQEDYAQFLYNFHYIIDKELGLLYYKDSRTLFNKNNLTNYKKITRITSFKELQKLINTIIIKSANNLKEENKKQITKLSKHILKENWKEKLIPILQNESENKEETNLAKLLRSYASGGSIIETIANYCEQPITNPNRLFPNSPEDLLNKLITQIKFDLKDHSLTPQTLKKRIPASANTHALSLTLKQKFFQKALQWKGPTELFLQQHLKPETTLTIAHTNYLLNGQHTYLGIQKTTTHQYKLVAILDNKNTFSKNPDSYPTKAYDNYLNQKWQIFTQFNKNMTSLSKN